MNEVELSEMYSSIKEMDELIVLAEALARLEKNTDFIKVISQEYQLNYLHKLIERKGDNDCIDGLNSLVVERDVVSIARLGKFFERIKFNAELAIKTKTETYQAIDELTHEGEV
jgi:hypothetical protein